MKQRLLELGAASFALLAPIHATLAAVGFLIAADLVTGIVAAFKRGEKIRSSAMRRTVSKVFVYQTAVITGFVLETYLLKDLLPVSNLVAAVIALTEAKSIFENLDSIYGGALFRALIKKLGSVNDQPPTNPPQ